MEEEGRLSENAGQYNSEQRLWPVAQAGGPGYGVWNISQE